MGYCIHIYFSCQVEKDAAFKDLTISGNAQFINNGTAKILDPSCDSNNFVTNMADFIEINIEVKTRILSRIILNTLNRYQCLIKDCEDSEEELGEPPTTFFR